MSAMEDQFAARFVCAKCSGSGGKAKRISTSGSGISKLLDIQHNQYITVSCLNCGYTEIYNPEMLEGKRSLGTVLDVLFGG